MKPLSLVLDLSASLYIGLIGIDRRGILAWRIREQGTRGEAAHGLLEECLKEAGAGPGDIASICVGVGPGSFTGIRVCLAMAQGLAFAEQIPLRPFSSLAAIAACPPLPAAGDAAGKVIAAIAANSGRYFVRSESPGAPSSCGIQAMDEGLLGADALFALAAPGTTLVTSGSLPDRERFAAAFARLARFEDTADFLRMARLADEAPAVPDGAIRPNYLMASAAEEKRRSAGEAGAPA